MCFQIKFIETNVSIHKNIDWSTQGEQDDRQKDNEQRVYSNWLKLKDTEGLNVFMSLITTAC